MKQEILKIQRSLNTNAETNQLLVYNKDRSITFQQDIDDNLKPGLDILFKGQENYPKLYCWGYIDEDNMLVVGEKVPEQEW